MSKDNPAKAALIADLLKTDLQIDIYQRAYARFHGTAAQLMAEGLIPDGFQWPKGTQRAKIQVGRFEYWLFRTRPLGHKGPMCSWTEGDYWHLRRTLANHPNDGFKAALIYEKQKALLEATSGITVEWVRTYRRACEAHRDPEYMAMRALLIGPFAPRKRGRQSTGGTAQAAQ